MVFAVDHRERLQLLEGFAHCDLNSYVNVVSAAGSPSVFEPRRCWIEQLGGDGEILIANLDVEISEIAGAGIVATRRVRSGQDGPFYNRRGFQPRRAHDEHAAGEAVPIDP